MPQISERKEDVRLIESLKNRGVDALFHMCKKEDPLKENKLINNFFKWKKEYLDEFERIFNKKFKLDDDLILLCLWYENKERTPTFFKYNLKEIYEESLSRNYIWRDKVTNQFSKWEKKYINKYIDDNRIYYGKWLEDRISTLKEGSILKDKDSHEFLEWEWVFKEEYVTVYNFEDFKKWYEIHIERKIRPEEVPKKDFIEIEPLKINFPNNIKKGLSTIGWLGERYVFSRILPSKLLEQYPDGIVEESMKGYCIKVSNQVKAQIIWNNKYGESAMNYDLKLIDDNIEYFIEVKTTKTNETSFSISCIEMDFAKEKEGNYILYLITNVGNENMKYYKFKNFYKMYRDGFFDKKSISLRF